MASGIRDIELLKSALGMPSATYGGQFLHIDIYEMAAAYLFHLVNNNPFVDGNKRVGAVKLCAQMFYRDVTELSCCSPISPAILFLSRRVP